MKASPDFVFRAVSGAVVYTAISVINALEISARTTSSFISVSPISPVPGCSTMFIQVSAEKLHITVLDILFGIYMLLLYDYMLVFCLSAVLQFVPSHVDVANVYLQ